MPPAVTIKEFPKGVQRLPVDAPLEDFIALMKRDGGVIVENFTTHAIMDQCAADIAPELEKDLGWDGEFFPVR